MKIMEKLLAWVRRALDKLMLLPLLAVVCVVGLFPIYFLGGALLLAGYIAIHGVPPYQCPDEPPELTAAEVWRDCHGCRCRTECWRNGECRTVCRDSCGQFCFQ